MDAIDLSDEHGQALLAEIGDERLPVLYRWTPPAREPGDYSDTPAEYAVVSLHAPTHRGDGGVMLYGRYDRGWLANPSARALVSHLLALAKAHAATEARLAAAVATYKAAEAEWRAAWRPIERTAGTISPAQNRAANQASAAMAKARDALVAAALSQAGEARGEAR